MMKTIFLKNYMFPEDFGRKKTLSKKREDE